MTIFYALKYRPFALLWSGQALSRFGDSLYQVSLAWWVLEETGSAAAMGTVLILSMVPSLLLLLIGGALVDRWPRVQIMLLVDGLRGLLVGGLAGLAWSQRLELWHIYLASILFGMMSALFRPAYAALIPEITPTEALPSANALTELSGQITGIIGPVLAALIIAGGGTATAFFLDSFTFLIAAFCLGPLRRLSTPPQPARPAQSIIQDIRKGAEVVLSIAWLWRTMLILGLINLTGRSPMTVSLPFLVTEHLQGEVDTLGFLLALFSLGSVLGVLWLGRKTRLRQRGWTVYTGLMIVGVLTGVMGLPISLAGAGLAILMLGMVLAIVNLTWANTLQESIPRELFGRVASLQTLASELALPLGFSLAGWATDQFGASVVFMIGGLLTAMVAGVGLLRPDIRALD